MPDVTPEGGNAQELWDSVVTEREAGTPPSDEFPAEPAAKEEPAPVEVATPAEAVATPEVVADPYEGLSPAIKARLEQVDQLAQAVSGLPQMQQDLRTANGRVAAMQRELELAKQAVKTVDVAPTATQIKAAATSVQKWTTLKQDFPDWADATEEFVAASLAGLPPPPAPSLKPEEVERLVQDHAAKSETKLTRAIEEAKVEGKYENWLEDINSPKFATWLGGQSPEVQALANSPRGRDAIKLLDAFHTPPAAAPVPEVPADKASKLAAAVTTKPGSSAPTGKTVDQMNDKELWEYERKRAAKQRVGLVY